MPNVIVGSEYVSPDRDGWGKGIILFLDSRYERYIDGEVAEAVFVYWNDNYWDDPASSMTVSNIIFDETGLSVEGKVQKFYNAGIVEAIQWISDNTY